MVSMIPPGPHFRRAEDRIHEATAAKAGGVILTDLDYRFINANDVFCEMTGFSETELRTMDLLSLTVFQDQAPYKELVRQLLSGKISSFITEKRYLKKGTGILWSRDSAALSHNSAGEPVGLVVFSENISPRKQMEREHEALSSAVANSSDFICIASIDSQTLFLNRAGRQLVGLRNPEEVHRTSLLAYFPAEDHDHVLKSILPIILGNGSWSGEIRFKHFESGQVIPVHAGFFLVPQLHAGPHSTVGIIARDITDKKAAEKIVADWNRELEGRVAERTDELMRSKAALVQAEKLEALGRLSGGVAHDFNNLMTGILGITKDLQEQLGPEWMHHADLEEISKAADKAAALTRQLLAFGRRQVVVDKVINLNVLIKDLGRFFDRISEEDIQIKMTLSPELGNVKMDQTQLEQIIINLLLNARDAMPTGGHITIQTANVDLDGSYSQQHFQVSPGPYVRLSISDSGGGMSKEVRDKIFEPFFTTKEQGKGTGLGLATVYGIVKQSGGDISVYSEPGEGTTFRIYFPRVFGAEDVERRSPNRTSTRGGTENILLVEDEDIVRLVASRSLRKRGYHVIEARNAQEALDHVEDEPFHLMLTDVVMPGMNGHELAKAVQLRRPALPILFMSGHSEDIIRNRGVLGPGLAFIEKAFSADSLCRKVREVLDTAKRQLDVPNTQPGIEPLK